MKRLLSITVIAVVVVTAINSCKKNSFSITERTQPEGKALVKIGLFNAYNTTSNIRISINGTFVSNELVHPTAFPGGGLNMLGLSNADYLQVDPGNNKFEFFTMNTGTPVSASKLFETSQTLEAGKRVTLFVTDTLQNTTALLINDNMAMPDSGFVRIKFVNLIPNVPALDLYKGTNALTDSLLISNIAYKGVSDYINIQSGTDSFFVRPAGLPKTAIPVARRSFALSNQRNYTLLSRGYNGILPINTNRSANISAIVNQ